MSPRAFPTALLLACALLPAAHLFGQLQVSAELDSSRILIGDQLGLSLLIAHDPAVRVTGVDWQVLQDEEAVEVLRPGTLDTIPSEGDQVLLRQDMLITSFDSGYHRLPPIPVRYLAGGREDTATTADLAMEVGTFPVRSDTASLAPIKTILEEPLTLRDVLPYAAGLLGLALLFGAALYFVRRRQAKPAPEVLPDPRPPHEVAFERLEKLRDEKRWQKGEVKAYYSELTYILRHFLEGRFRVPALESTTGETSALLDPVDIDPDWKKELIGLFRAADAVKFAKARPPAESHDQRWALARALVERAVPPEEPEGTGEGGNEAPD